jgi:hypothetical protein
VGRVRWSAYESVYRNDTPVLEFLFTKKDGQNVVDLTGYQAEVAFWAEGSTSPYVIRAASLDVSNGIARYFCKGDEFGSVGDVFFQATVRQRDGSLGVDRAYFSTSHPVVRWRVIQKP